VHGGEVVFSGSYADILESDTQTGNYLSGRKQIIIPRSSRPITDHISIV